MFIYIIHIYKDIQAQVHMLYASGVHQVWDFVFVWTLLAVESPKAEKEV